MILYLFFVLRLTFWQKQYVTQHVTSDLLARQLVPAVELNAASLLSFFKAPPPTVTSSNVNDKAMKPLIVRDIVVKKLSRHSCTGFWKITIMNITFSVRYQVTLTSTSGT